MKQAVVWLLFLLFAGCASHNTLEQREVMEVIDCQTQVVASVRLTPNVSFDDISDDDRQGILHAVARTPKVAYEIFAIKMFPKPPHPFPVSAEVRVEGFYLYLCKAQDGKWHTFRTAQYEN